jgi:hypothetical protein
VGLDLKLLLLLLAALAVLQGVCWLLARGLGARLERRTVAIGLLLPMLFLAPWWADRSHLLVPSDVLHDILPDVPKLPALDRHDLLSDAVFQFLPWELEIRHALRDGRLPLWSDDLEGGSSPWVNPQAGVLSPLAMLARPFPIQHFLLGMLALKMLLAVEGTWLLARAVGASRRAADLAAVGFALSGGMMTWALFPHTATLAWVPWLTLGVIRLFRPRPGPVCPARSFGRQKAAQPVASPGKPTPASRLRWRGGKGVVTTAWITGALLLSGHPETAAIGGLFAAVCGLSLRSRRRSLLRGLGAAAAAALLGGMLAAPHLLPFALHLPGSQRAQEATARSLPAHYVSLRDPLTWFVPGNGTFLVAPTNPWVYGRPYQEEFRGPYNWVDAGGGYAGLVAFAGSAVALAAGVSRGRRRRVWPFLGFALICLLATSQFLPMAWILYGVPGLRALAFPRFLLVGCLGLSIAGALGIDRLLAAGRGRLAPLLALGVAAGVSLAQNAAPWILLLWVLVGAAALLGPRRPRWAAAGLGLALLLDLVPWSQSQLPAGQVAFFYPPSKLLETARRETTTGGPWRAVGEDFAVFPCLLPVYGVAEVRPHNPLAPMPQVRGLSAAFGFAPTMDNYFPPFRAIEHPFLDFLNVRAVVWISPHPVPPWLERIDDGGSFPFRLYRNPRALPRWFVPTRVDVIRPGELERWIASLRDGRHVAVYGPEAAGEPAREATVKVVGLRPGRIALEVSSPRPTLVATSIGWPEGWRVRVDGARLPVVVVNGAFVGFRAPAGTHRIDLLFVPPGLLAGCGLALAALLACVVLWARRKGDGRP